MTPSSQGLEPPTIPGRFTPGVSEAHRELRDILEDVQFDPVDNTVGVVIPERYKRDPTSWFGSLDEITQVLVARGDSVLSSYASYDGGEPVFGYADSSDLVYSLLERSGVVQFFETLKVDDEGAIDKFFDPREFAASEAGSQFRIDLAKIDDELVRWLAKHPEKMHSMHPRKFEELVAELFKDMGYEVELTPPSKDGGRDLLATRKEPFGLMLTLVECKRYAPTNPVGVEIVRSLYGVMESERASHAVVATTSRFTSGAIDFHARNRFRLSLADYDNIQGWISNFGKKR
jgi:hypothetical protein